MTNEDSQFIQCATLRQIDLKEDTGIAAAPVPVFLNLSNHPSASWSAEQTAAAQALGRIADMPFPQIPPAAGEDEVEALADTVLDGILSQYAAPTLTVHLMGEMTFTYALVARLKAHGVRCVASCTERVADDLGQGNKMSRFQFVRFRDY